MNTSGCHSERSEESDLRKEHFTLLASRLPLPRRDVLIFVLLLIPIWIAQYLPLQDYPDWLLEGRILSRINSPEFDFSSHYKILSVPIPNLASTVIIGALDRVVPIEIAGKIFLSFYVLLYAASIFYLFRSVNPSRSRLELVPILFTYNYFFFVGNLNYLFSLPWLFFALGFVIRRRDAFTWRHAAWLCVMALIIYFSHFVSFAILVLGIVSIAIATLSAEQTGRKAAAPFGLKTLCALLPAFVLLAFYLAGSREPFEFTYFHSIRYRVASIVTPFLLFFRFYPIQTGVPTLLLDLLVDIFILLLGVTLAIGGLKTLPLSNQGETRRALLALSGILFLLLLFAPSNVSGLVRLNQRMALPFLVLFFASVNDAGFQKRIPSRSLLVLLLASIIVLNAFTIHTVGAKMRWSVETVLNVVPRGESPYVITERFDRSLEHWWDALTPEIYPFDRAAFYHTIRYGGANVHLFDTSIVRLKRPLSVDTRSTTVGTLSGLAEKVERARPQIAAQFPYVIVVGSAASFSALQRALAPNFVPIAYAPALCILHLLSE